jgi:hypothetical protein
MSRLALALLGEELAVPVAPRSSCGLSGGECADSTEDEGDGGGSDYSDTSTKERGRRWWCPSSQGCPVEQTRTEGPFLIKNMYTSLGWVASQGHTVIKQAMQRPTAD